MAIHDIPPELVAAMGENQSGSEVIEGHTSINGRIIFVLSVTIWGTMDECQRYRELIEREMMKERGAQVVYDVDNRHKA